MTKFLKMIVLVGCLVSAKTVEAIPLLQLDILDGHYDPVTQTVIAGGNEFTLVALLTPRQGASATEVGNLLADTYYISAALNPVTAPPGGSLGSFNWEGTSYDVTGDMTFGTPPIEAGGFASRDPGDLSPHGIFPTYFAEFSFQFDPNDRTVRYDTQTNTGGLTPTTNTNNVAYYALFNVTTSLSGSNILHFDLYDTFVKTCRTRSTGCTADEDIDHFAPFSHDAQSTTNSVPEPQSLLLFGTGLVLATRMMRRKAS